MCSGCNSFVNVATHLRNDSAYLFTTHTSSSYGWKHVYSQFPSSPKIWTVFQPCICCDKDVTPDEVARSARTIFISRIKENTEVCNQKLKPVCAFASPLSWHQHRLFVRGCRTWKPKDSDIWRMKCCLYPCRGNWAKAESEENKTGQLCWFGFSTHCHREESIVDKGGWCNSPREHLVTKRLPVWWQQTEC